MVLTTRAEVCKSSFKTASIQSLMRQLMQHQLLLTGPGETRHMGRLWPREHSEDFQSHTTFSTCFSQAFPTAILRCPEHSRASRGTAWSWWDGLPLLGTRKTRDKTVRRGCSWPAFACMEVSRGTRSFRGREQWESAWGLCCWALDLLLHAVMLQPVPTAVLGAFFFYVQDMVCQKCLPELFCVCLFVLAHLLTAILVVPTSAGSAVQWECIWAVTQLVQRSPCPHKLEGTVCIPGAFLQPSVIWMSWNEWLWGCSVPACPSTVWEVCSKSTLRIQTAALMWVLQGAQNGRPKWRSRRGAL